MSSEATIWKYDCPYPGDEVIIEMPIGAKVVKVHDGCMWVTIPRQDSFTEERQFMTVGTGESIVWDVDYTHHVGTWFAVEDGEPRVWHVLEFKGNG